MRNNYSKKKIKYLIKNSKNKNLRNVKVIKNNSSIYNLDDLNSSRACKDCVNYRSYLVELISALGRTHTYGTTQENGKWVGWRTRK